MWMKRLSAHCIMLSHGASCVAGTPPPFPRGTSYAQRRSERWVHTCTSAPGNASPQRSRKVPSEGFIQRCSALGGNRLHWWLIYRINTKGIGFLCHFFSLSLSFSISPLLPLSPSLCLCKGEALVHAVKQSLNIFSNIFSPVKSCLSACYIARALQSFWQRQLKWKDGAVFKWLNTVCAYGSENNQSTIDGLLVLVPLAPSVSLPHWLRVKYLNTWIDCNEILSRHWWCQEAILWFLLFDFLTLYWHFS